MKIFKAEKSIKDVILENTSVSCEAQILPIDNKEISTDSFINELKDSLSNVNLSVSNDFFDSLTSDVIPLSSILVSDIWNKNDDVFTSEILISSFESAKYKPINWMHKGSEFRGNNNIGVMINTSMVKGSVSNLSDFEENDFSDLSDRSSSGRVHIKQDGIIWSTYFPSYSKLIKDGIEEDNLFVSMECLFNDFGYAFKSSEDGNISYLERNESTAHFSSNLRAYGGDGEVTKGNKKYSIGRWFKSLVFSGQGIVDKPANTKGDDILSVILSNDKSINNNKGSESLSDIITDLIKLHNSGINKTDEDLVFSNKEKNKMSEDKNINELQKKLDEMTLERDKGIKTIASLKESVQTEEIEQLQKDLDQANNSLAENKEKIDNFETDLKEFSDVKEQLAKVIEEKEKFEKDLQEIRSIELARERLKELKSISSLFDEELDEIKVWNEKTFEAVKKTLTKAGVSGESKLTDQTVSGEPKLTDQTVTTETKLTEANEKEENSNEEDSSKAIENAETDESESDLVVSEDTKKGLEAGRNLVRFCLNK